MNDNVSFDIHCIRETLDKILAELQSEAFAKRVAEAILNQPSGIPDYITELAATIQRTDAIEKILGASADHVEITDLTEGHIS